jgi:NitT/TauT family transport system substrate-binding protein
MFFSAAILIQWISGMRAFRSIGLAFAVTVAAMSPSDSALAQTAVRFLLDSKLDGPAAPLFVAIDKGYFKAEGLDVTIETAESNLDPLKQVAAGDFDMGLGDFTALMKFLDAKPASAVRAVFMFTNRPAFAVISRKSRGVEKPKDLEGKTLGAPAADGAYAQWKIFVQANGIDASKVKIENVGFPVREPMLADGKVDAITGFSFSMHYNLLQKGLKPEDIKTMLMADHGLVLYGNAIMVNPDFAKANPKVVAGFVRATIKGVLDTIKDPDAAIKSVMSRNETGDPKIELDRLKMSLRDNFVTPWVKANGFGDVDMTRLAKSIDQIALTYDFKNRPKAEDIFTSQYLPPAADRKL